MLKYLCLLAVFLFACSPAPVPSPKFYPLDFKNLEADFRACEEYKLLGSQYPLHEPCKVDSTKVLEYVNKFSYVSGGGTFDAIYIYSDICSYIIYDYPSTITRHLFYSPKTKQLRGYLSSDFLSPFIFSTLKDSSLQFYRIVPACWVWRVNEGLLNSFFCENMDSIMCQNSSNATHFRPTTKTQLKSGKPFEVFSHAQSPQVKIFNDMLADIHPHDTFNVQDYLNHLVLQLHCGHPTCHYDHPYVHSIDTQSIDIYCKYDKKTKDSASICWNYGSWEPASTLPDYAVSKKYALDFSKSVYVHPQKALGSVQAFDRGMARKLGFDLNEKFVQLSPVQVRTMRLPALCPPRDSLTAIADYIDQTQPTFILFKKYFRSCEIAYNYFLLYYFDFPEGKAPILRDIRVVVPDNFGLNISPN